VPDALVPQLLHALWAGHPSQRARIVALLERVDDATLEAEPAAATFRRLLAGPDLPLVRAVARLVARRGLAAYGPDLVALLSADAERRELAEGLLRRAAIALPRAELLGLASEDAAAVEAAAQALAGSDRERRRSQAARQRAVAAQGAALRLLREADLGPGERRPLLAALAEVELHAPLLKALEGAIDADLVAAAVAANARFGERVDRRVRELRTGSPDPTAVRRLFGPLLGWRPDAIGERRWLAKAQAGFRRGIARLAIAARDAAVLPEVVEVLGVDALAADYVEACVATGARAALARLERRWAEVWAAGGAAPALELHGRLGDALSSARRVLHDVPQVGAPAVAARHRAAIVALARLVARDPRLPRGRLDPLLDAAVESVRRAFAGRVGASLPGHPSTWGACFEAAAVLGDARFGEVGLAALEKTRSDLERTPLLGEALGYVDPVLPAALASLDPLELRPTLERVLDRERSRPESVRGAVEVVRRRGLKELLPRVVAAAEREPAAAAAAGEAVAALLEGDDGPLALDLVARADPGDGALVRLLERAGEVLPDADRRALARTLLERGRGGARAQRQALRALRGGEAPDDFLQACAALFRAPEAKVRATALREAIALGLLAPPDRGRVSAAARDACVYDLLLLATDALRDHDRDEAARDQVTKLLDALLPPGGAPEALPPEAADDLRGRVRQAGLWTEAATFHAVGRELLELARAGLRTGLLHGAVLELQAEGRFLDHATGERGPYTGPLPHLEAVLASPSPYVQEALFDLVASPGYLRTQGLLVRFLASPRPRVRREVLTRVGLLTREGALAHAGDVLGSLADPDPAVRRAGVGLLARLELGRFAPSVRLLLDDPDGPARLEAARTLAGWGDRSCLEHLGAFLGSDDVALRREAVRHLRRFEPALLAGGLARYVRLETPVAAAAALAALRPGRLPDDDALKAAVLVVAAEGRGPLRARALRFLPDVAEPRRLGEVVPLLGDADPDVRRAAAHVLRRRDGRRFAPAAAELAAATDDPEVRAYDSPRGSTPGEARERGRGGARGGEAPPRTTQVRLEVLELLADLGVAEAARGLLPLLLDEDARVRARARDAVAGARGYSLQPELERLLREALDGGAAPGAIEELVDLLERTGDDEVFPAIAEALRCEDRRVWEAVVAAARAREADAHAGRLVELLSGRHPLPPALETLAIAEVERCGRRDAREALAARARAADAAETVRRRALQAAAALGDLEPLRSAVEATAMKRERTLAKAKPRRGERVPLRQARGTVTFADRLKVAAARSPRDLEEAVAAVPPAARRASVAWTALERAGDVLAGDPRADLGRVVKALPGEPALDLVRRVRDRVEPREYAELLERLTPVGAAPLERAAARLFAEPGRPADPAEHERVLMGFEGGDWRRERDSRRAEAFYLACMADWRPELRPLFGAMVARARRAVDAPPADRWAHRDRQARGLAERSARIDRRLDLTGPGDDARAGILALADAASDLPFRRRYLAAAGDVAGLAAELARAHGETQAGDRAQVLRLLGEVGGAEAARTVAGRAAEKDAEVRADVAWALGLAGDAEAARAPLAALLGDEAEAVRVEALGAAARLGAREHTAAATSALGDEAPAVRAAACAAAARLGVEGARALVARLLVGPSNPVRRAAARALETLADPGTTPALLEALGQAQPAEVTDVLTGVLIRIAPDDALDDVGRLLGAEPFPARAAALRVLGARGHRPAAPAVRELLADGSSAVRAAACAAAGALGDPGLRPAVLERLDPEVERDRDVQTAAVTAAARLADDVIERRDFLRERLAKRSARTETRTAAAVALAAEPDGDGASAAALLEVVRRALYPDVELPGPGEPLERVAARLEGERAQHVAGSRRRLVDAAFAGLVALEAGEPLERAAALLWRAAEEPFGSPEPLDTLGPWLEARPEAAAPRLLALAAADEASVPQRVAALRWAAWLAPVAAAPAVAEQLDRDTRYTGGGRAALAWVRALVRAVRAGAREPEGRLRELALADDERLRIAARAGLEPERWARLAGDPELGEAIEPPAGEEA